MGAHLEKLMDARNPDTWEAPAGPAHPDFDPGIEIAMLKDAAKRILRLNPRYAVELEAPDPAYVVVTVQREKTAVAEIHVVLRDDGKPGYRFGIFGIASGHEGELYADDAAAAADAALAV